MQKLLIKGKRELSGIISISGSKNASLPILAATILAQEVKLSNVPLVKDIFTMLELLKFIGMKVKIISKQKITDRELNTIQNALHALSRISGVQQFGWVQEILPKLHRISHFAQSNKPALCRAREVKNDFPVFMANLRGSLSANS